MCAVASAFDGVRAGRPAASLVQPVGPVGYVVGYALAGDQLRSGWSAVAESVNPLAVTRDAWRETGLSQGASVI